jgi:hypothetical protein
MHPHRILVLRSSPFANTYGGWRKSDYARTFKNPWHVFPDAPAAPVSKSGD